MWSIKLTDCQREALRLLIEAQGEVGPSLTGALESLELARWDDLPEAELPWDRVSELARAQGIGEADVVWDLAAGMGLARARSRSRAIVRQAGGPPPVRRRSGL
jgi:hypothetical protein